MTVKLLSPLQIGMEGKGFEPTVDALFGENGFFPDTTLKTMYFVSDNMPLSIKGMLQKMLPPMKKDAMRRQVIKAICSLYELQSEIHCRFDVYILHTGIII